MEKNINLLLVRYNHLESERILLRPVTLDDAQDIFEYTSDEETTRYLYDVHTNFEQTERMVANYFVQQPIGKYAMVLKETNKVIGAIEFRVDDWNEAGDLGFTMNRHYWGKGYMTEAASLIIQLAFEKLNLARVFAGHEVANEASGKVLQRLGMQLDGVLRKQTKIKGQLVDSMYYSILKEDYFSMK